MQNQSKKTQPLNATSGRIFAVIVTFNPEPEGLNKVVSRLLDQVDEILIVDNGSIKLNLLTTDKVRVHKNKSNLGLGAAHNIGIKAAVAGGFDYVLIMDQDSVPSTTMTNELLQAHQKLSRTKQVAAVGATYWNEETQIPSFYVRFGWLKFKRTYSAEKPCAADFLISSGSLFHVDVLEAVGNMDEELFIDHVDTEWFLRARNAGYQAYGVPSALMEHNLGEHSHRLRIAGRTRNVPQHKPFRYYYIFRNSVSLYRRSYVSNLWKWNDLQRLGMIFFMFAVLKGPRIQNAKMMGLGLWHGMLGKLGPKSQ